MRGKWRSTSKLAVEDVTFDVMPGEIFGLLGPNGAGKTTIFRMLSTVVVPDAGTAIIAGFDVATQPRHVRRILASVPADERSLNWRLSARDNLSLFAALYGLPRPSARRRIEWALTAVGLHEVDGKLVAAFSSGMRQRLLTARALLSMPKILLLDEPTRSLDPMSAIAFRQFLRQLVQEHGCTILLATHNADEAFHFCGRVAVLHQGRVLATGPAERLASSIGRERHRILTDAPEHCCFELLERRGDLKRLRITPSGVDGWSMLECDVQGDCGASATLLRTLVENGVRIARIERMETSLADLIARVIGRGETETLHA